MRYWKRLKDGKTNTVESYSHDLDVEGAIAISQMEFKNYIDSLPKPKLVPMRELVAEIDDLKAKVAKLEGM